MSLNWNIDKVKDKKRKAENNWLLLRYIVFASMMIGVNSITKNNYVKFYARLKAYQNLFGNDFLLFRVNAPKEIKLEDVEMWIGLRTNSSNMTASQFEKRLSDSYLGR